MVETDLHETSGGDTEPTTQLKQRKLVNNTIRYQKNGLPASNVRGNIIANLCHFLWLRLLLRPMNLLIVFAGPRFVLNNNLVSIFFGIYSTFRRHGP